LPSGSSRTPSRTWRTGSRWATSSARPRTACPTSSIVSGSGLIAAEVIADLESEAQGNGTEASSIGAGDGGKAYGSPMRSAAATEDGGNIVEVEIFSEGTEPIGDKRDEAVEILEQFLDLND